MSKRTWRTIRTILILIVLLVVITWLYTYFNGGDTEKTLTDYAKKEGLYLVIGAIFLTLVLYVLSRVFRIRFWRS